MPQDQIAPHANFNMMNGPIPGEGLTNPPGSAPYQNPPQFVHLDELLEYFWFRMNQPDKTIQIYGLLKAGTPCEAIARTLLLGAFSHGICSVDLAQMAVNTVVRQIAALGHFLGLKKMKIKNHKPETTKQLAQIQKAIDDFGSVDEQDEDDKGESPTATSPKNNIFTGLGM